MAKLLVSCHLKKDEGGRLFLIVSNLIKGGLYQGVRPFLAPYISVHSSFMLSPKILVIGSKERSYRESFPMICFQYRVS